MLEAEFKIDIVAADSEKNNSIKKIFFLDFKFLLSVEMNCVNAHAIRRNA